MPIQQASFRRTGRGPAFPVPLFIFFFVAAVPAVAVPVVITGQLMGEGGHVISRATIELVPMTGSSGTPRPVVTGASDTAGRFRLAAPEPGMWKVIARAGGYAPLEKTLSPLVETTDLPVAGMKPASLVEVRVVGADGTALAGVRIRAELGADSVAGLEWQPAVREGVTGKDGTLRLPRARDEILRLQAVASRHLPAVQPWTASFPVRLRLEPGRERTIEVRSSRGTPLRGVDVRTAEGVWLSASDERGQAAVFGPVRGDLALVFESRSLVIGWGTLGPAPEGNASPAVFSLVDPPSVSGKVVDADSRLPVAGALVWPEGHPAASVRASADGGWTLAVSPVTGGRVRAAAPGYLPAEAHAAGGVDGAVLALSPRRTGGRIAAGVVVDEGGRPVGEASISLVPVAGSEAESLPKTGSVLSARSDRRGRFKSRLPEGTWDLRAGAPGLAATVVRGITVGPGHDPVDLGTVVLRAGPALDGQVVDSRDKPIAGCHVRALPTDMISTRFLAAGAEDEGGEALSGADGGFTLAGLQPGQPVTVRVWREGYTPATLQGIQVPAEKPLLVRLSPVSRISGRVFDEYGSPVPRARVVAVREPGGPGGEGVAGPLDEDGGFVVENVAPGGYTLAVAASGFLPGRRQGIVVAEGKDTEGVEVVLRKGGAVEGRVVTADGRPVARAEVRVMPSQEAGNPWLAAFGLAEATTGEDGSYRLEGVAEGTRSVSAERSGHPRAVLALEIRPGTNHLDFQLTDGREVSGRVVDTAGRPVPGAAVSLFSTAGVWPATTAPDGGFQISGVPDGAYRLVAEKAGWASARSAEELRVAGGAVTGIELRLDRGATIAGRIAGLGFEELSRVQVTASGAGGGQVGSVDYQGSYRIEALAPGDWILEAQVPGTGRRAVGRVRLEPGQSQASLDLEFGGGLALTGVVLQGDRPVAGAAVTVRSSNGGPVHGAMSGPDGRFRVEGLQAGNVEIAVLGKSAPFRQLLDVSADQDVVLRLP
jgi:hypothetical protein